MKKSKETASTW